MITREELIDTLTAKWDAYLERFEALPDAEKKDFLSRQGYPRLAELLVHFSAWWRNGMESIHRYQQDPSFHFPEIDVDVFNKKVILRMKKVSDAQARAEFDATRREMTNFIKGLSDADLADPKINRQLQIEIADHLNEHQ